jgi:hypothetical protein
LRDLPTTKLTSLPRMADFAVWATAAECGLGLERGTFLAAYQANRNAGNEVALESSPVGKAVMDFIAAVGEWKGTSTDLLEQLESRADDKTKRLEGWPKAARPLSGILKRIAPNLRTAGVGIEFSRTGRKRTISLARSSAESCVTCVTSVSVSELQAVPGDDPVTQNSFGDARDTSCVTAYAPTVPGESREYDASDAGVAKVTPQSYSLEWTEV